MERSHNAPSEPARRQPAAQREADAGSSRAAEAQAQALDSSPRQLIQRRQWHSAFGSAAQRAGADEEMLQGRFTQPLQRVEEEEPLQGQFGGQVAGGHEHSMHGGGGAGNWPTGGTAGTVGVKKVRVNAGDTFVVTIPSGGKVSFMPNGSAEWVDLGECGPVNVTVEHESIESAAQFRVDVANVSASMGKQS